MFVARGILGFDRFFCKDFLCKDFEDPGNCYVATKDPHLPFGFRFWLTTQLVFYYCAFA